MLDHLLIISIPNFQPNRKFFEASQPRLELWNLLFMDMPIVLNAYGSSCLVPKQDVYWQFLLDNLLWQNPGLRISGASV